MPQAEANPFEITVITGGDSALDLSSELRHVKAALLYADRVRLVSPNVAMLETVARVADGSDSELIDRLMAMTMPPDFPYAAELKEGLHRKRGRQRLPEQIAFDGKMRAVAASTRGAFEQYAKELRSGPELAELHRARNAGVLELDGLGLDGVPFFSDEVLRESGIPFASHAEQYAAQLLERMVRFIGPSDSTYPLLDARMIDLIRELGIAPEQELDATAATEPHLAASMIGRMESFPDAGVDEILDVRKELDAPLVRFRSAVASIAREMEETPLDEGFGHRADALYREHVAPALLEIKELEEERGIVRQLVRQTTIGEAKPDVATTIATVGAVGLAATQYSSLPTLAAAIGGLSGPVLSSAYNLYAAVKRERDRLAAERKTNKFLFLVEANRRLADKE